MAPFKRYFTLSEARACIPELRRQLERIHNLLAEVRAAQDSKRLERTLVLRGNGKGPVLTGAGHQREEAQKLSESIAANGILIKDLEVGLVDFPHHLNGDPDRVVLLCWRLGEDTIEYWHDVDAGFSGRQRVGCDKG